MKRQQANHNTQIPVSVIVPTYNREHVLLDVIDELLNQNFKPLEIIIMDQTLRHSPSVQHRLDSLHKFGAIRYFRLQKPNAQRARNLGVWYAEGEIIILIDDDVRIGKDFVWSHWRNYIEDLGTQAVAGQVLWPNCKATSDFPKTFYWPHIGWYFFPLGYSRRCETMNIPSCNMSIRRNLVLKLGGFDENFTFTWYDDTDFSWRLHLAGIRIVFDPEATLLHLNIPCGGKRPDGSKDFMRCNRERWTVLFYFWLRHFGWRAWRDIWRYLRASLINKPIFFRPQKTLSAFFELYMGISEAYRRKRHGPILPLTSGCGLKVHIH